MMRLIHVSIHYTSITANLGRGGRGDFVLGCVAVLVEGVAVGGVVEKFEIYK